MIPFSSLKTLVIVQIQEDALFVQRQNDGLHVVPYAPHCAAQKFGTEINETKEQN